jgi:predicted lysophospholipase L1 biosynthesis ABC-type transport system permease subunit
MTSPNESLQTLAEIRDLMQRSSKFLSLSGLSGIWAGIVALIGAGVAYLKLNTGYLSYEGAGLLTNSTRRQVFEFLLVDGICVLVVSLFFGVFFTVRKAKNSGQSVWNSASKRLLISLAIPLITGGIFCLGLFNVGIVWLIFPSTLIFYGLALLNASKYTLRDVEYLGICQIVLGLISLFLTGYNLLMWSLGFGVLHIVYGTFMYFKYDKK